MLKCLLRTAFGVGVLASAMALGQTTDGAVVQEVGGSHKRMLEMGDVPGNAHITRKGNLLLRVFESSSYGWADGLELKSNLLANILSQNLQAEYGVIRGGDFLLSTEVGLTSFWGTSTSASVDLNASQKLGSGYFNAQIGVNLGANSTYLLVPFRLGYSLVTSPHTIWDFRLGSDALLLGLRLFSGYASFMWNHSFGGPFQLGLGAIVLGGISSWPGLILLDSVLKLAGSSLSLNVPVVPLPMASFSFKF